MYRILYDSIYMYRIECTTCTCTRIIISGCVWRYDVINV